MERCILLQRLDYSALPPDKICEYIYFIAPVLPCFCPNRQVRLQGGRLSFSTAHSFRPWLFSLALFGRGCLLMDVRDTCPLASTFRRINVTHCAAPSTAVFQDYRETSLVIVDTLCLPYADGGLYASSAQRKIDDKGQRHEG